MRKIFNRRLFWILGLTALIGGSAFLAEKQFAGVRYASAQNAVKAPPPEVAAEIMRRDVAYANKMSQQQRAATLNANNNPYGSPMPAYATNPLVPNFNAIPTGGSPSVAAPSTPAQDIELPETLRAELTECYKFQAPGVYTFESGNVNYAGFAAPPLQSITGNDAYFLVDRTLNSIAELYKHTKNRPSQRDELEACAQKMASILFKIQQLRRKAELESIEKRVVKLRDTLEKREKLSEQIISSKVNQVLGIVDGFGWDMAPPLQAYNTPVQMPGYNMPVQTTPSYGVGNAYYPNNSSPVTNNTAPQALYQPGSSAATSPNGEQKKFPLPNKRNAPAPAAPQKVLPPTALPNVLESSAAGDAYLAPQKNETPTLETNIRPPELPSPEEPTLPDLNIPSDASGESLPDSGSPPNAPEPGTPQ